VFNLDEGITSKGVDFLKHYGVKGMKWGVRKAEQRQRIAENVSDDARSTAALRVKAKELTVSSLSNDEIRTAVTRIKLEQEYSRLTYEPSKIQKGAKVVKTLLGVANTTNQVVTLAKSPAAQVVKDQLAKQKAAKTPKPAPA